MKTTRRFFSLVLALLFAFSFMLTPVIQAAGLEQASPTPTAQATTTPLPNPTSPTTLTSQPKNGANTNLPYYIPYKPVNFSKEFVDSFDAAFKQSGGEVAAKATYDFLVTPDAGGKIVPFYDNVMKEQGFSRAGQVDASSTGLKGTSYIYAKGQDGRIVTILGPLTAEQANSLNAASPGARIAANDTLIVLVSGLNLGAGQGGGMPGTQNMPYTGEGGSNNNNGVTFLWLALPLALMATCAGLLLRKRVRKQR
ncbi:MAG TPA: hypothetical protein VH186_11420 [Chloroflexia bacterium]|nr:hypothetical protein [Chloroflexia bacterium]